MSYGDRVCDSGKIKEVMQCCVGFACCDIASGEVLANGAKAKQTNLPDCSQMTEC